MWEAVELWVTPVRFSSSSIPDFLRIPKDQKNMTLTSIHDSIAVSEKTTKVFARPVYNLPLTK